MPPAAPCEQVVNWSLELFDAGGHLLRRWFGMERQWQRLLQGAVRWTLDIHNTLALYCLKKSNKFEVKFK